MSFLFDKVAGLARAIAVVLAKTKFLDHVKISSTSQLIKGIFKLFQKLHMFQRKTTFGLVNESLSSGVFPTILALYLKDPELEERGSLDSSL